jgi:molecular chaperone DnaK
VTAQDKGTGQEQKITISGTTALSDDEIDRMVDDAESHAEDDLRKKEEAEARNNLDSLVYQTEKFLDEAGDKLSDDDKSEVESALEDAKKALEGDDVETMKNQFEVLQQASLKLGQVMYDQAEAQGAAGDADAGEGEEPEVDEEVVDYEVVEEDE